MIVQVDSNDLLQEKYNKKISGMNGPIETKGEQEDERLGDVKRIKILIEFKPKLKQSCFI